MTDTTPCLEDDDDFDDDTRPDRTALKRSALAKIQERRRAMGLAALPTGLEPVSDSGPDRDADAEAAKAPPAPESVRSSGGFAAADRRELAAWAQCEPLADAAARAVGPADALEAMMTDQLAASHAMAMQLSGRAQALSRGSGIPPQYRFGYDLPNDRDCARAVRGAAAMMATFRSGMLALDRIRNGNRLTITVERAGE